jgi:phage baseplate assembly protein W
MTSRFDPMPARISMNPITARQSPKSDFGSRLKEGIDRSGAVGLAPAVAALEDMSEAVAQIESYVRLNQLDAQLVAQLASLRMQLRSIVMRSRARPTP